jgi:hypothetical protein
VNVQGANRDVYCAAGWVALVHANEDTPGVRDTITPRHAKMDIMVPNAFTVFLTSSALDECICVVVVPAWVRFGALLGSKR